MTITTHLQPRDWTLLALAAAGGREVSPVQLQKSMFLLGRQMPEAVGDGFYKFEPYNYGPFDRRVYVDAEHMQAQGLTSLNNQGRFTTYAATPQGMRRALQLREANPRAAAYLDQVVKWALSLSFTQLVRAIYEQYPEMREKSVFVG